MTSPNDETTTPAPTPAATPAAEERRSTPGPSGPEAAAGGMGSSSERVGPAGRGQVGTDGLRDTSRLDTPDDAPPEQSAGGEEARPDGLAPKAATPVRTRVTRTGPTALDPAPRTSTPTPALTVRRPTVGTAADGCRATVDRGSRSVLP
jgi:hypothetical protein